MKVLLSLFFYVSLLLPSVAHALCNNPEGQAGDQVYNVTHHVMQYCNGQNWVKMGSVATSGDNMGNHTATDILNMSGFRI